MIRSELFYFRKGVLHNQPPVPILKLLEMSYLQCELVHRLVLSDKN
ncbi:hypothetical protein LINPERPRIM_LOCUS2570 [Linum perenne]